jgi:hypothetical protein
MKMKSLKSLMAAPALLAALAMSVQAGPVIDKNPIAEKDYLFDSLNAELAAGYDSRYYFRGLWFSNNNVWTSASINKALSDKVSLDLFSYYTDNTSGHTVAGNALGGAETGPDFNYSELDLGAALNYDAGFAALSLGYTYYRFFDGFFGGRAPWPGTAFVQDYAHEVGLSGTRAVGPFNVTLGYYYDIAIAAHYLQGGIDTEIPVTPWMSIVPSATIGYGMGGYYTFNSLGEDADAWNHIGLNLAFPISLTPTATLTPYAAGNLSMEGREGLNTIEGTNELFGGAALSVTF